VFKARLDAKGNNRVVMPLNDRTLYLAADVPTGAASMLISGAFAAAVAMLAF
jgi:hypothetical protein